ncbi:MAG: HAD-IA family hydrolase [Thiolinea sp.]
MRPEKSAADQRAYQLLIFDWDGTLMDSSARIVQCMHCAANHLQLPPADEQAVRHVIGLSLEVATQRLYPDLQGDLFQQFVDEFRRQSLGSMLEASRLFAGAKTVLHDLSQQGYQLAVATGKSRRGLDQDMLRHGVAELFPISRTADETFSKPHPQMLEEILTDHDLEVQHALMIGDTEYDLQMAVNAGMDALGVSYGVHPAERLLKLQPRGVIDDILQLPEWLNKNDKGLTDE